MADHTFPPLPVEGRRFFIFQLIWPIASLILMASTWRLWVGTDLFPQIPLFSIFVGTSLWIDYVALAICGAASLLMVGLLVRGRTTDTHFSIPSNLTLACLIWTVAMMLLFLTNQHRLQPWAWQFFVFAILTMVSPTKRSAVAACRAVVVSIYLWSAIGKFDYQFLNGLGRQFASAITDMAGISAVPESISPWAVALLPLGELLVGALLIHSVTRRSGVVAAVTFHLGLVAILGPWGMGHHAGVVIWNFFFAIITAVLFWPLPNQAVDASVEFYASTFLAENLPNIFLTTYMIALPLIPICDHWLAWGLYSPNNRRCTIQLVAVAKQNVDLSLQPYLVSGTANLLGGVDVLKVDIGRMSLDFLDTPIYPEARMQLGVIKWIENRFDLNGRAMMTIESKSDRFSGERDVKRIDGRQAEDQTATFFFNHLAR